METFSALLQQKTSHRFETLYRNTIAQIDETLGYLEDNHTSARLQMQHVKNEFLRMMPNEFLSIDIDHLIPKSEQEYLLAHPSNAKELFLTKYKQILEEEDWVDDENPKTPPKYVIQQKQKHKQVPLRKNPPMNIPSAQKKELISQQKFAIKKGFTSSQKKGRFRFRD